jgi:hypothetical protein
MELNGMRVGRVPVGLVVVTVMAVIAAGVFGTSLLMANQRIPNAGNVKAVGVGVYWDSGCTENVTSIDWGFLEPGETTNVTVYVKNDGNIPVALFMKTDNWSPLLASENIALSWNRESYVLNPGSVEAVLTLVVAEDIEGVTDFSFDITITGTEYA